MNDTLPPIEIEQTKFTVSKSGPLTAKDAVVIHKTARLAALQIDFKEKYLKVVATGSNDDIPTISVCEVKEGIEEADWIELELSEFAGWSIWAADRGKYSVQIALILK